MPDISAVYAAITLNEQGHCQIGWISAHADRCHEFAEENGGVVVVWHLAHGGDHRREVQP